MYRTCVLVVYKLLEDCVKTPYFINRPASYALNQNYLSTSGLIYPDKIHNFVTGFFVKLTGLDDWFSTFSTSLITKTT